jgi:two-component system, cell cycle sensor histidine kinase and response regulator CckA
MNALLAERMSLEQEAHHHLDQLETRIGNALIQSVQQGKDPTHFEQLLGLVSSYRESLLRLDKMSLTLPSARSREEVEWWLPPILAGLDDLALRLRTISASTPEVVSYGRSISTEVQLYRESVSRLAEAMVEVYLTLEKLDSFRQDVLRMLEEEDRETKEETRLLESKIGQVVRTAQVTTLGIAVFILILVTWLTVFIARRGIERPLRSIILKIGKIRSGESPDSSALSDIEEWRAIETALQEMWEELTRANSQLRDSEERFRKLFEDHSAVQMIIDPDTGDIVDANQAAANFYGWAISELKEMRIEQINTLAPQAVSDEMEKVRSSGGQRFEFQHRRADGSLREVEVFSSKIETNAKTLLYSIIHDITQRKGARKALRESEARYRLLAENATDVIWTVDMDMQLTYVSPSVTRLLGYTPEQAMARTMREAFTPAAFEKTMKALTEEMAIEGAGHGDPNRSRVLELELVRKDGETVPVEGNFCFLRDPTGRAIGLLAIVRDITERKRAEEAILRAKEDWEQTFDAVPDLIAILDKDYRIVRANEAMAAKLGVKPKDCIGLTCYRAVHGMDEPPSFCPHSQLLIDGYEHTTEVSDDRLGGDFIVSVSPMFDSAGTLVGSVHVARDITERKRAEEERLQLEQGLQQAQKAESLGRMAAAIAHHFNNMLHAVMGNLELASDGLPQGSTLQIRVTEAMKASRRAAEISSSMLTYLGQTTPRKELIDLVDVTSEALLLVGASLPKKVHLEVSLPSEEIKILGDATHINQILTNLVLNAGEAIHEQEGFITLTIHAVASSDILESRYFPLDWKPAARTYACVSVSDTGCGMDAATQEKIFDPFFSTKFTGRGLGLPVSMGLIRAHDGVIALESRVGWGSSFRFYLPISELEALPSNKEEALFSKMIEGQGLVLLVEDEPMVRNMAEAMLKRLGYEVITACDGSEALEIFRERKDKLGLVLLDLSMPRMGGWETLPALRALRPDIPVILASGYDEAQVMQGDHPELPQAFLHKPYGMTDLKAALVVARKESIADR